MERLCLLDSLYALILLSLILRLPLVICDSVIVCFYSLILHLVLFLVSAALRDLSISAATGSTGNYSVLLHQGGYSSRQDTAIGKTIDVQGKSNLVTYGCKEDLFASPLVYIIILCADPLGVPRAETDLHHPACKWRYNLVKVVQGRWERGCKFSTIVNHSLIKKSDFKGFLEKVVWRFVQE